MEINIKCSECGKGTRNFELSEIFYLPEHPAETIIIKDDVFCPKCRKNISNEKCTVKLNDMLIKLITANICLSSGDVPQHLQGAFPMKKRDYDAMKNICKSRLKFLGGLNEHES